MLLVYHTKLQIPSSGVSRSKFDGKGVCIYPRKPVRIHQHSQLFFGHLSTRCRLVRMLVASAQSGLPVNDCNMLGSSNGLGKLLVDT